MNEPETIEQSQLRTIQALTERAERAEAALEKAQTHEGLIEDIRIVVSEIINHEIWNAINYGEICRCNSDSY